MVIEIILLAILLVCAVAIVVAVTMQKSSDEGLSGTIAGGSETYYGKDKSVQTGRTLRKWTIIVGIVFAVAVVVVYIIQPDYVQSKENLDTWKQISDYASIFPTK